MEPNDYRRDRHRVCRVTGLLHWLWIVGNAERGGATGGCVEADAPNALTVHMSADAPGDLPTDGHRFSRQ